MNVCMVCSISIEAIVGKIQFVEVGRFDGLQLLHFIGVEMEFGIENVFH